MSKMLNTRSIKINEYSDSDSKLQIENISRKKVICSKLQIENIFKKKTIRGIFNCWLNKNGIDKELLSIEDWCNMMKNLNESYQFIAEITFDDENEIEKVFIGQEVDYDEEGSNYSWQINMTWLSNKFISKIDDILNLEGKFSSFIKKYFDSFEDKINIRFSIPSAKIILPQFFVEV